MTASKPQLTIILHCTGERWWAHWRELHIHVPLPFPAETKFDAVHENVKAWYPNAIIVFDKIEVEEDEAVSQRAIP
jgi:hypothetical protein